MGKALTPVQQADALTDDILAGEGWSLARYGDGEWIAILGGQGPANRDGQPYTPSLQEALRETLRKPAKGVHQCIGPLAQRGELGRRQAAWFTEQGVKPPEWCSAEMWMDQLVSNMAEGKPFRLKQVLETQNISTIMVGPKRLLDANPLKCSCRVVEVPEKDSWSAVDQIEDSICHMIDTSLERFFVSLSCGMTATVLAHRLAQKYGDRHWFADLGSLWDAVVGHKTRRWITNLKERVDAWKSRSLDERRETALLQAFRALKVPPGSRVIDIACGTGWAGDMVAALVGQKLRVTYLDIKDNRVPKDGREREFIKANAISHNLSSYDAVLCLGLLYHLDLDQQQRFVKQLRGKPVVLDTHIWAEGIETHFGAAGTKTIRREGFEGVFRKPTSSTRTQHPFVHTAESLKRLFNDHQLIEAAATLSDRRFYACLPK